MKKIQWKLKPQRSEFDIVGRSSHNRKMAKPPESDLKERIAELETEIAERERDIAKYRDELARANVRLETLIAQIHQELKLAHSVQKVLVPTEFPHVPGFEFSTKFVPSMIIGGDYFDIFSHEDRLRFGVVLASSSGHAMSALFLSVLLKFTGQMEARRGAEPDKIMVQMVKELLPNIEVGSRADIFYGLVDRRSYELTYCRLGEVAALHQSFSNGEIKLLEGTGSFIEPGFSTPVIAKQCALNPRDRLILCSRGILEAKSLEGEPFGLARLSRSVVEASRQGVHELRNQVLFDVQKFAGYQEPPRDVTLVVVEVKDKVIKLAKN